MKRILTLAFILMIWVSTIPVESVGGYIEEFTYYLPEKFESVSPWDMQTHSDRQAISAMYSGLFIHQTDKSKNEYIPMLASEDAIFSSNGTNIEVALKSNLNFSNGEKLTAEDVVFTYHTALSPAINKNSYEYYTEYFKGNESIYSVGEKVYLELSKPFVDAYDLLTLYIVSKEYYSDYFEQGYFNSLYFEDELTVTSGVYTLLEMDLDAQSLDLIKNEYYWDLENVDTDYVYLKYITKSNFLSNEPEYSLLDPLFKLTENEHTMRKEGAKYLQYLSYITLVYNFNHPMIGAGNLSMNPEDTLNIRKAIHELLDVGFYFTNSSYELGLGPNLFYSFETVHYDIKTPYGSGNFDKSIEFMEFAGFNFDDLGEPDSDGNYEHFFFNITVSSSPDPLITHITEFYSNKFSKIGIGVSAIKVLDYSEYDNLIYTDKHQSTYDEGGYDLLFTTLDWDLNYNPYGLFNEGVSKSGYVNYFNYYNSSYETIIDDYNRAISEESKVNNLRLIFQHIADNVVVSPLFTVHLYAPYDWKLPDYFNILLFTYQSFDWADISDDYVTPYTYTNDLDPDFNPNPYYWLLVIPAIIGLYITFAGLYFFYNKMRKSRNKL